MACVYGETSKTSAICIVAQVDSNFDIKTDAIALPKKLLSFTFPSGYNGQLSISLTYPISLTLVETQYLIKGNGHLLKI